MEKNGFNIPGADRDSLNVDSTGIFSVNITDTLTGCSTKSAPQKISLTVLNVLFSGLTDTVCSDHSPLVLSGMPPGGVFTGNGISGNTFNPIVAGPGNHLITYQYSDVNGCTGENSKNVFVEICSGLDKIYADNNILIYPNPSNGKIMVQNKLKDSNSLTIKMYDLPGKFIRTITDQVFAGNEKIDFDCSDLPAGVFIMQISSGKQTFLQRLMIIK